MFRSFIAFIAALVLSASALATEHDVVYVKAVGGSDGYTGLTPATPVATIARGLAIAASSGRRKVHVAGGNYQPFTMASGIDVIGGFDQQFVPAASPSAASTATILAPLTVGSTPSVAVVASDLKLPTRLSGFQLRLNAAAPGRNAIGLLIRNSMNVLTAENLQFVGMGASGAVAAGIPGQSAPTAPANAGAPGIRAGSLSGCTTAVHAGGAGGNGLAAGGRGGSGGRKVTDCNAFPNINASAGQMGLRANDAQAAFGGSGGAGTPANSTAIAGHGGNGSNGRDGLSGQAGSGAMVFNGGNPYRTASAAGAIGTRGAGGGGGGGGGGFNLLAEGASGGGGGAGGEAAMTAGQAGASGNHSIAIVIQASSPTIRNCTIARGNGVNGGRGGNGGQGQPGGAGGAGGAGYEHPAGTYGRAGNGGNGGRGGHSGAGAGGHGGHSIGILRDGVSAPTLVNISYSGGAAGQGGLGGTAPHQPGGNGLPGGVHDVLASY